MLVPQGYTSRALSTKLHILLQVSYGFGDNKAFLSRLVSVITSLDLRIYNTSIIVLTFNMLSILQTGSKQRMNVTLLMLVYDKDRF